MVTCVCTLEVADVIVCGSKDCKISIWKIKKSLDNAQGYRKPKHVIYGHHNEIVAMCIERNLNLLVSADRDGVILFHSLSSNKLIRCLELQVEHNECVKFVMAHGNGIVVICTDRNRVCVYK